MDKDGNLLVYNNKGRPSKEEKIVMSCSDRMRDKMSRLKAKMGYDKSTEVLLACSIASDQMLRHVHMFPEVFFMDVTSGTNRQKLDLFLLVVCDANAQCHVGNVTFISSCQSWVFLKIYETFFELLYGKETINRNRLCLTDEDKSEYGPLERMIATENYWHLSKHMLCIFHALVKQFHELIYPLLPSKTVGGKRVLTDRGKDYGA